MYLLQSPPLTRYDLNFSILGFSVRVHPFFWLMTLLLGSTAPNVLYILLWIGVVFVSILIHELGHALAFRRYGIESQIVLHFGGVTIPMSNPSSGWSSVEPNPMQHIVISLAGPLAGFMFAGLTILFIYLLGGFINLTMIYGFIPSQVNLILPFDGNFVRILFILILWVNVFWGLINLLPIYPLDGGQISRSIFIQSDPWGGVRKSLWLSTVTGGLTALIGWLAFGNYYMAILFGLLAFQSYQALQVRY